MIIDCHPQGKDILAKITIILEKLEAGHRTPILHGLRPLSRLARRATCETTAQMT
jgi:hypothetical protein